MPNPKSILITGGAGFIGSHLAEALLERGYHVTVIDNPSTSSRQRLSTGRFENIQRLTDHPRFRFAIDGITNEVVMDRLVSDCDMIFHLAAAVGVELIVKDPVHVIETNTLGTHIEQRSGGAGENAPMHPSTPAPLHPVSPSPWHPSTSAPLHRRGSQGAEERG
ncbi:MAG TPA: NAD-dependent epimerase/dehydratase family protein [Anaerolineae bacterium]|nr:NAD-dependent epimerase/dehydratase family protein [Anaerolineae bacterium]